MSEFQFSLQNIHDGQGVGIAVTGMSIVFFTLIFISFFIAVLPRILETLKGILPAESAHHGAAVPTLPADSGEEAAVAALGYALHVRRQTGG